MKRNEKIIIEVRCLNCNGEMPHIVLIGFPMESGKARCPKCGESHTYMFCDNHLTLTRYSVPLGYKGEVERTFDPAIASINEVPKQRPASFSELFYELDEKIIEIAQKGDVIIDSKLSAYILESIADFKILLVCDLKTRVERMTERDNTTFDEKMKETKLREKSELERFKKLYNIDLNDKQKQKKLYNLIIDIENLTIEQVEAKILDSLKLQIN